MEGNQKEYEQIRIQYPDGDIWIRRTVGNEEEAEIISGKPGIADCLKALAEGKPDAINVIADDDAQEVHAIVKDALHIEINPASGDLSFVVESLNTGEDGECTE